MSLLDLIRSGIGSVANNLMPNPDGLTNVGLLGPQDVNVARRQGLIGLGAALLRSGGPQANGQSAPPFGQALGEAIPAAQGAYQGALQTAASQKVSGAQTQYQLRMLQLRDAIAQRFPGMADMDPADLRSMLPRLAAQLALSGDTDTADVLNKAAQALPAPQQTQLGDQATTFVPSKGFYDPTANGGQGGYVPTIARGMNADEKQIKQEEERIRRLQLANSLAEHNDQINKGLMTAFQSRTKPLVDRAALIQQALMTLSDASNETDPAKQRTLYSSAIANFVQAADQKAQLRMQLLRYYEDNVDPSIKGRWTVLRQRLLNGTLPQYTMQAMIGHLTNLNGLVKQQFEKQRAGEVGRHPTLDGWLPQSEEIFGADAPPPSAAGAGPNAHLPGNPFAGNQ